MHNTRRSLALATLALALAACGDGAKPPTEPLPTGPEPGVLRFDYSGSRTGQFRASGRPAVSAPMAAYAYQFDEDDDDISIVAYQTLPDARYYDDFAFDIADPKVGTVTCANMSACPIGFATLFLARAKSGNGFGPNGGFARATSARVTITALTQDSIKGSFDMQFSGTFAEGPIQIAVSKGEFSLPRIDL
ncbi:MAG TPA: hypothetical protein VEY93_15380 [Longimicrobium sp.]|jgi:hypothetical protein|nr:hypothetical protein [Longimicrobium sp.]